MLHKSALFNYHYFSRIDLEALPPGERTMFDKSTLLSFKKKEQILREGDALRGVYIVVKGMVKASQINANGKEQIIFFFSPQEIFGYQPLLGNDRYPMNAVCIENSEIRFIEAAHFMKILDSSSDFTRLLLTKLAHEFVVLVNRLNIFAQKGVRERLALALILLNEKFKLQGSETEFSNISINKTDLASYIGTSVDVLSRNIKYFKEKRLIRTHGKSIFIIDFNALLLLTGIL